ncbi:acetyl-CoA carboxylase biotin carboxyl carrier protein subunit [Zwartia vadi]|uniref:acetyl-CoA carboxylase biotin carboxyl carrier protein subunit n=1 Tax=Zwartia vadi TaxID=3058168 RepID=UPI0025B2DD11|nr:acetyl-CoA carboxylase biotin carboxyl carrier protein subunit [Zwartia vadi]MDN3987961.1 acetyl-CoA carboxylase biotin carboxyl carrier protein subunit [Zwartia vadi]
MARIEIMSEVTGKVWKIVAAPGTSKAEDEEIMILESMKMEIPVVMPEAGTLLEILVAEGDSVEDGQIVAVIDA